MPDGILAQRGASRHQPAIRPDQQAGKGANDSSRPRLGDFISYYRPVVSVAYHYQAVYVKFIGTHKAYDTIDAGTVEMEV